MHEDLQDMTGEQLVFALDQIRALQAALALQELRYIVELDARHQYLEDGSQTSVDWLVYRYDTDWNAEAKRVEMAYVLEEQPELCKAYGEGRISSDKLAEIATFVEPEDDGYWAQAAQERTFREVRDWARVKRRRAREETARAIDHRSLKLVDNHRDGVTRITGTIPLDVGAIVRKALDRIAEAFESSEDGTWPTLPQRRADAFVHLSKARLASDPDTNRATVVIHCAPGDLTDIGGTGKLEHGPIVTGEVVRRLSSDGYLEVVLHGEDGEPIGIGRRSRIVPPSMMRELKRRDDGCGVCGNPNACHAHHVVHWADGGRTDLDNLILLCWKCHRLVHDKLFSVTRNRHGTVILINPDGIPVPRRPEPLRPEYRERILGPPVAVG